MFTGSIDSTCRKILAANSDLFTNRICLVGCSGNFTFEQLLSRYAKPKAIYSNDVSLYSCALGWLLTGTDYRLEVVDPHYAWLAKYLADNLSRLAAIIVLMDLLKVAGLKNDYQKRVYEHIAENWESYFEGARENIEKAVPNIHVDRFFAMDVFEFFKKHSEDPEAICLSFMPTYKGGYERIYKGLHAIFDWDMPAHSVIDGDLRDEIYSVVNRRNFLFCDDRELDYPKLAIERKNGTGRDVYLYSNASCGVNLVEKTRKSEKCKFPSMGAGDVLTTESRLEIVPTTNYVINHFKDMYLSKSIRPKDGKQPFLVLSDGKVLGFLVLDNPRFERDLVYLLSDFCVPHTRYVRLSKLVAMLALSVEVRDAVQEKLFLRIRRIRTTAFTRKPVSMKYRGIFELEKRGEGFLNYVSETGRWTKDEAFRKWMKNYGGILKN